jgi:hypothetical protein
MLVLWLGAWLGDLLLLLPGMAGGVVSGACVLGQWGIWLVGLHGGAPSSG